MSPRSKPCLLGICDHQGVMNVGGRVGAASGPHAFRKQFSRFKDRSGLLARIEDIGDVIGASDVAGTHQAAAAALAAAHRRAGISVVIGGGHDHGFSQLLGIQKALGPKKRLGCINIDAHLDVRGVSTVITSGSPFFLAIESGVLAPKNFVEFGIQSHCNSPELWSYVEKKKVQVIPFEKLRGGRATKIFRESLRALARTCDAIIVSWDLDAASQADAPGVSAPQAEGFSGSECIEMMEIAGAEKKVISLGIFELNPHHDENEKTARLAATGAFHFLLAKKV